MFIGIQSYLNYLIITNGNLSSGLGRRNVSHLIRLHKVTFYNHLFLSNSMSYNVFNFALVLHNYSGDDMLRTVFMPQYLLV